MSRTEFVRVLVLGMAVALVSVIVTWRIDANQASGPAFTADITERDFNSIDGATTKQLKIAWKSDGSNVKVIPLRAPDGTTHERRTILDISKAEQVVMDFATESTITFKLSKKRNFLNIGKECMNTKGAHSKRMGYDVVLLVHQADHGMRLESWLAPALRCAAIEEVLLREEGDQTIKVLERKITNIQMGRPSQELFASPASFIERSPAQFREEKSRRYEIPLSTSDGSFDRKYLENR